MSDDTVERLREEPWVAATHYEAADEITRLRADLAVAHQQIKKLEADNAKQRQRVMKWVNAAQANEEWDD